MGNIITILIGVAINLISKNKEYIITFLIGVGVNLVTNYIWKRLDNEEKHDK